jgi:hypothetical protein
MRLSTIALAAIVTVQYVVLALIMARALIVAWQVLIHKIG